MQVDHICSSPKHISLSLHSPRLLLLSTSLLYLGPPAGQNKVGVDVLLSKLLCDVEPQGAVFVVDVPLGGVGQDGVGVVDLLKLVGCLWVVRVLVRVKFQRQFPETEGEDVRNHSIVCE